jgi:hypothetical protein
MAKYTKAQITDLLRQAGFPESAIPTMVRIAQLESTNNTQAFNDNSDTGDLSYGLFQINMLGDMGPERRKWFGIKSNEELYDPLTNAKAAYKLWSSKEKQGKGKGFTHWSTYNEQIAGNPNLRTQNIQGMTASGTVASPFENTGDSFALVQSMIDRAFLVDPEVGKIFQSLKGEIGPDAETELTKKLQQTKFWQKLSLDIQKEVYSNLALSPADYAKKNKLRINEIKNKYLAIGATPPSDAALQDFAKKTLLFGLEDDALDEIVFNSVRFDNNYIAGQSGIRAAEVYKAITDFGGSIDKTSKEFKNYVFDAIRTKGASVSLLQKQYADEAAKKYPQFADRFKSGATLRDVASPYFKWASELLETPIDDVNNNVIQQGLGGALGYLDFTKLVKQNPAWQYTYNASENILGSLKNVLNDFGFGLGVDK